MDKDKDFLEIKIIVDGKTVTYYLDTKQYELLKEFYKDK